jgi:hypothetical protein
MIINVTTAMSFFYEKKSEPIHKDVPCFNQCGIDGLIVKSGLVK